MKVEATTVIAAPRSAIWEYISDPARSKEYMRGITRWETAGERDRGKGARYSMRMKIRSAEIGGLIEIVEYDPPGNLAWTGVTGLDQRGRWRLRERPDGSTSVTFRLTYTAPGGLLGAVAARVAVPIVKGIMTSTLAQLKRAVESSSAPG